MDIGNDIGKGINVLLVSIHCQYVVPSGTHQSRMESQMGLISPVCRYNRPNLTMASLRDDLFPFWVVHHGATYIS